MTWDDLLGWMAYGALEPFGEQRADLRAGELWALIANVHRDSSKRAQPFTPEDMPNIGRRRQKIQETPMTVDDWERAKAEARVYAQGK
jgi:hypothetical protein